MPEILLLVAGLVTGFWWKIKKWRHRRRVDQLRHLTQMVARLQRENGLLQQQGYYHGDLARANPYHGDWDRLYRQLWGRK